MKQKTRFKNFAYIGIDYWSMNGWCISIGPKKATSVNLYKLCLSSSMMPRCFKLLCF